MFSFLKQFIESDRKDHAAKLRYAELVAASRHPEFFTICGLPDSLNGRYESIVLQIFKEECQIAETSDSMEFLRNLHEAFFEDMDRSLREEGIGDTGVGKRVKKMASGLYGRLQAYRDTMHDEAEFKQALLRNAYATCDTPPSDEAINALVKKIKD